jgi:ABC-type transport system involved in multi-copper enzyme maturation permease subunit
MKFLEIFRFEFAYQIRRPLPWLFFAILVILNFLMTRDNALSEALYDEFLVNSPFAIAKTTVFGTLIWLVMAPVIAGTAAARDVETRMHPLLYTSSINKTEYLGARFLAALVLNALILLAVQIGIVLAIYSPGVDATLIGRFRLVSYITAYGYIALPNAFVATAIQFSLATRSGKPMASYLGSVLLVFMGFFVASILLWKRGLGTLLDPIGIRFIVEDIAHLWTTIEKSSRLLEMDGIVLKNRLLWLSIGGGFIAYAYFRFQFSHQVARSIKLRIPSLKFRNTKNPERKPEVSYEKSEIGNTVNSSDKIKYATPSGALGSQAFGLASHAHKTFAIAWSSFQTIATSWSGLALLLIIPLITVPVVVDQMESGGGVLVPTTIRVIRELTSSLSEELSRWVIIPAFIIFFAGELIWRERDARLDEITDAIPGSEWVPLLGKFLGLGLVLALFTVLQMIAGILAQILMDYDTFEFGLYLKILFGLQLPEYLLFVVLALVVHVVVDQKYTGHMVAIIIYVFIALSSLFGVEHNLLVYGAGPGWSYTDMRGFGPSLVPWLWFKLYWTAWALLLAVVARLLWVRSKERGFRVRLKLAQARFKHSTAWITRIAVVLIMTLGGFIFYNTNVLNQYLTDSEMKERQAEYEHQYGRYKDIAQPTLTGTSLNIEIYPEQRSVNIEGTYRLVNQSATAIDSMLVTTVSAVQVEELKFDRQAAPVLIDEQFNHRVYVLGRPLLPGDSLILNFRLHVEPKGFRESGVDVSIVDNGTFFTDGFMPAIGYQENRELISATDRREHGLPQRPLIASLYDTQAPKQRGGGVIFEAVIGTNKDQVAGAPGLLKRTWTEGDRSYYHYSTSRPIGSEWAFFSAKYALREEQWKNPDSSSQVVIIQIFHMPDHTAHLDRMVKSIRASLEYYTEQFGPYRYSHLTVAEGPGEGTGLHAEASMLTHSEGFALWNPKDHQGSIDFPFAVVAHEVAHQWTVPYANVEGAPVMSESIAWYYAMKVVEKAKGLEHLRGLLSIMRQPHPIAPIRRGEPLLRGLDQYLSYRRGPFALYTMSEYVGEERINKALRNLLEKHRSHGTPLATTLDLYRDLQAATPDSLKYLLHDLFEVNTYWELKTERALEKQLPGGAWEITLDVQAHKDVTDSAGVERSVPMDDWIEIGVFTKDRDSNVPLYLQKHRIRSGKQIIKLKVPQKPERAGIDPYHLLIDLKTDDNVVQVKTQ